MRLAGGLLIALGLLLGLIAFNFDTTVYSSGSFIGGELVGGGSSHNLGLLQQQMMILHTGLAAFIAGSVLFAIGSTSLVSSATSSPEIVRRDWDEPREGETELEAEERIEGVRKTHQIIGGLLIVIILGFWFLASQS